MLCFQSFRNRARRPKKKTVFFDKTLNIHFFENKSSPQSILEENDVVTGKSCRGFDST